MLWLSRMDGVLCLNPSKSPGTDEIHEKDYSSAAKGSGPVPVHSATETVHEQQLTYMHVYICLKECNFHLHRMHQHGLVETVLHIFSLLKGLRLMKNENFQIGGAFTI